MKNSIKTFALLTALFTTSCGSAENQGYAEESKMMNEEAGAATYTESAEYESYEEDAYEGSKKAENFSENHQQAIATVAATTINDGNLRFIRTANITYKTKNVRNTTYFLEKSVTGLGGIVTYTNLYSNIENVKKVAVSNDSSLKITTYQVNNDITIRVPKHHLDSLLKIISTTVVFLDHRVVSAEEISLKELKNQLEQNNMANYQVQLKEAIANKDGKINNVVDAYDNMLQKQKLEDEALIRNLELDYEVNYCLVQLSIYQNTSIDKELVENEMNIEEFEPSFGTKLTESLENGWKAILSFVVVIANAWFLLLAFAIIGGFFWRRKKKQGLNK